MTIIMSINKNHRNKTKNLSNGDKKLVTASTPLGQAPFGTACAPDKNHDDNNDDDDGDDGGEEEDVSASNEGDVQVSQCTMR